MVTPDHNKETEAQSRWAQVWRTLLLRALLVELAVAVVSIVVGLLAAGIPGLYGAIVGTVIAAVFLLLSVAIMYVGRNLDIGILGGVMGLAFIIKAFVLMIVVWSIKDAHWINGAVAFFTIIAAVVLTSILEVRSMLKARVPYVDPDAG